MWTRFTNWLWHKQGVSLLGALLLMILVVVVAYYQKPATQRPATMSSQPFRKGWYRSTVFVYEGKIATHEQGQQRSWTVEIQEEACENASRISIDCELDDPSSVRWLFGQLDGKARVWTEIKLGGFPESLLGGNSYYPTLGIWEICAADKQHGVTALPMEWVDWGQSVLARALWEVHRKQNLVRSYSSSCSWM